MSNTNIQTVRDFIEVVFNQKKFEQAFTYLARDCVSHNPPYIGLGIGLDDSSDEELKVIEIASGGPADGKLLPGDVVTCVTDGEKTFATFEQLRDNIWALGIAGTSIVVTVRRDGKLVEVPIMRGRVEAFDMHVSKFMDMWKEYTLKYLPDLTTEIRMIFGSDDLVATYLINSGNNLQFHRFAVWSEYDIYRLKDGRIIEMWGMEDNLLRMMQLGYEMKEPLKEKA